MSLCDSSSGAETRRKCALMKYEEETSECVCVCMCVNVLCFN